MKRKQLLEHDFAVTGWVLSILPEIGVDFKLKLDGDKRMVIERVIAKLHVAQKPNSKVSNDKIDIIIISSGKNLDIFRIKVVSMECTQAGFSSQIR